MKRLHLIVACAENRVIGRQGRLPWRIPEDLEYFHRETAGQICVLGRVCFDTWPRVMKDGRRPVVLTSRPLPRPGERGGPDGMSAAKPEGAETAPRAVRSLDQALLVAESLPGEVFICGGQRIYEETLRLNRPMTLHLTLIHAEVPGDTFFPEWRHLAWQERSRRESADVHFRYTFYELERP